MGFGRSALPLVATLVLPCLAASGQVPSDAEIRKILADRLGSENLGVGIVVGVIDANGRRVVSYGGLAKDDKRPLDGDTVFEIGSVTKVFTSLLLMDMARRGEVALTDPIAKYLPAGVKVPERNGREITLADLSTQSSGLPREASNLAPKDEHNPYADYSVKQLYDFLSSYQLTRDIGAEYEYSNVGVGLLGHVLSLRAGMSYEALLRSRICDPLGMPDTRITLTPEMKRRVAVGHDPALTPVAMLDNPTLPGAGGPRSTANDMLTFLAANLGFVKTPLAKAMADEVSVRRPAGAPDMEIAYGWHVQTKDGQFIVWHNGGTEGYHSYLGFDPRARNGVIVLSNVTPFGVDDIGQHLLNASYPLSDIHVADSAKRFKDQTQSPGTEAALRRLIKELRVGRPSYEKMAPQIAEMMRRQLPRLKTEIAHFGKLRSVTFKGVGPAGADIYEVKFKHANTEWRIKLSADGKVQAMGSHPL